MPSSPEQIDLTLTRLSQLSHSYGVPATNLAERVIQHSAQGQLIVGFVFLVLMLLLLAFTFLCSIVIENSDGCSFWDLGTTFGCVFGGFGALACGAFSLLSLNDIWMWTALSDPQLALAHQIFSSMGGN